MFFFLVYSVSDSNQPLVFCFFFNDDHMLFVFLMLTSRRRPWRRNGRFLWFRKPSPFVMGDRFSSALVNLNKWMVYCGSVPAKLLKLYYPTRQPILLKVRPCVFGILLDHLTYAWLPNRSVKFVIIFDSHSYFHFPAFLHASLLAITYLKELRFSLYMAPRGAHICQHSTKQLKYTASVINEVKMP